MTNKYVAIFCSDLYYSGRDSVAANPIIAKNLHIRNFGELFFESSLKASCEAAMKVAAFCWKRALFAHTCIGNMEARIVMDLQRKWNVHDHWVASLKHYNSKEAASVLKFFLVRRELW
ncbi:MAG: hypothetical protein CMF01_01760 [Hyphomonas sp.]|nr:hypothetical protein [Hyphomonas sp.]